MFNQSPVNGILFEEEKALPTKSVSRPGKGKVKSLSKSVESLLEPVELFEGLNQAFSLTNNMLLESSEIESKENVKSILLLKAALRIQCDNNQLVLQALTENGKQALEILASQLKADESLTVICHEESVLAVKINPAPAEYDQDKKLKQTSPVSTLRKIKNGFESLSDPNFSIFLGGVFAFDFIATFEKLPEVQPGKNQCPDYVFYLAESLLVIDHQNNSKRLICNYFFNEDDNRQNYFEMSRELEKFDQAIKHLSQSNAIPSQFRNVEVYNSLNDAMSQVETNLSDTDYAEVVENLKQNIIAGDIFQVVPSRTFTLPCASPIASYRQLKITNPSPYMFFMQDQDFSLFGASPESALKYTAASNEVLLYPIAGTRPRGKKSSDELDLDLDARLEAELKLDKKEVAEHMMLVDLARNDIARISKPGTTHVPRLLAVDRYSQVMHLVSCVKGQLREDLDALHAYQACMNMGTLTGAPKIRATELIREAERERRGSYGGAVGYLNGSGDMDTCIVIRAAFCQNQFAYIQAGAGVVFDSIPSLEAEETLNKAKAVLTAIARVNALSAEKAMEVSA